MRSSLSPSALAPVSAFAVPGLSPRVGEREEQQTRRGIFEIAAQDRRGTAVLSCFGSNCYGVTAVAARTAARRHPSSDANHSESRGNTDGPGVDIRGWINRQAWRSSCPFAVPPLVAIPNPAIPETCPSGEDTVSLIGGCFF
jgi:hypothetical protein